MRKSIGSAVLVSLVIYLFAKSALVMRPKETIVALTALIVGLVNACCGTPSTPASPQNRAALEEGRKGNLVGDSKGYEGRKGHVDARVLDHTEVLGVQPGQLGSIFLCEASFFPKLPQPKAESTLGCLDRLPEARAKPGL